MHVLQTLMFASVNTGDDGRPKTAMINNALRGRWSSQAIKHATRLKFEEMGIDTGVRTRNFSKMVTKILTSEPMNWDTETTEDIVKKWMKAAGIISDSADAKDTIGFFGKDQATQFATVLNDNKDALDDKKSEKTITDALEKAINNNCTADILLFGRMFASNSNLDKDASVQVAHALTVQDTEFDDDWFSACEEYPIEDENGQVNKGSAHISSKSYISGTFYKYANLNLSESSSLVKGADVDTVVEQAIAFMKAFVLSVPTGGQNSSAANSLPDYICLTLSESPVTYEPVFNKPVTEENGKSIAEVAADKIEDYRQKLSFTFGDDILAIGFRVGDRKLSEVEDEIRVKITELLNNR